MSLSTIDVAKTKGSRQFDECWIFKILTALRLKSEKDSVLVDKKGSGRRCWIG